MAAPALKKPVDDTEMPTVIYDPQTAKLMAAAAEVPLPEPEPEVEPGAKFGVRALATIIDGVLFGIVQRIMGFLLHGLYVYFYLHHRGMYWGMNLVVSLLLSFYFYAWPISEWGQTPGKRLMGLRVVNTASRFDITLLQAFGREVIGKAISIGLLGYGFLCVLTRKDRLALHDRIFKTKVVKD